VPRLGESTPRILRNFPDSERLGVPVDVLYREADVPLRHRRRIDDEASPKEWVKARDGVIGKLGSGFVIALLGKRGPGKTQIAEQAIAASAAVGWSPLYVRAMTFFLALRATFSDGTAEEDVIERYRIPRFLVIDEMHIRGETRWEDNALDHLVDVRYGDRTDTLFVANLKPKAFTASIGESIADRIRETGGIVECNWKSFRQNPDG
jgi:DNA replication protein DnaC